MIQNKITIDGKEYELIKDNNVPSDSAVYFKGKRYIGKAIPNKPEKEKDYRILDMDLRNASIGVCYYHNNHEKQIEYGAKIRTVQRLSDNEVFTVGDKVMWNLPEQTKTPFTIKSFEINDVLPQKRMFCNRNNVDIHYLKKSVERIHLFITEDGKEIFQGDSYVSVQKSTLDILDSCIYNLSNNDLWLTFSTMEKAKDYVIREKPCLSYKDVLSISSWFSGNNTNQKILLSVGSLKKLAKEKLNN